MNETAEPATETVRIGGINVNRVHALERAGQYLSGQGGYGYPAYDAFDGGGSPAHVSDGDLLAPQLLNVAVKIRAFYALQEVRGSLDDWLSRVPTDAQLGTAGDAEFALISELFALLDDSGIHGVRGTTLAKIMHRKRPDLVPLYDRFVWATYVSGDGFPIARARKRSWSEFMSLLARAMQVDLLREREFLAEVAGRAKAGHPVTALRALDIVAWQAGKDLPLDREAPVDEADLA